MKAFKKIAGDFLNEDVKVVEVIVTSPNHSSRQYGFGRVPVQNNKSVFFHENGGHVLSSGPNDSLKVFRSHLRPKVGDRLYVVLAQEDGVVTQKDGKLSATFWMLKDDVLQATKEELYRVYEFSIKTDGEENVGEKKKVFQGRLSELKRRLNGKEWSNHIRTYEEDNLEVYYTYQVVEVTKEGEIPFMVAPKTATQTATKEVATAAN